MTGQPSRSLSLLSIVTVLLLAATPPVGAQERQSPALVSNLASLMAARQLEAVAAQDPEAPDRFVAALLMPDVQLLLVSAQYPAPAELQAQLTQQNYRDVYAALHQPSAQATRFFVMDAGCDGLRPGGEAVDVLYEKGTTQTLFDGRWKQQGLSETAYTRRVQEAEGRYARLLSVLTTSLQAAPASAKTPGTAK
jgi:hypothetical protein